MTTSIAVEITHGDEIEKEAFAFELLDRKGRMIGYRWTISPISIRPLTVEEKGGLTSYRLAKPEMVGDHFRLDYSVTRDGKDFGAGFHYSDHPTLQAARDAGVKVATAARKRYAAKPEEKR